MKYYESELPYVDVVGIRFFSLSTKHKSDKFKDWWDLFQPERKWPTCWSKVVFRSFSHSNHGFPVKRNQQAIQRELATKSRRPDWGLHLNTLHATDFLQREGLPSPNDHANHTLGRNFGVNFKLSSHEGQIPNSAALPGPWAVVYVTGLTPL